MRNSLVNKAAAFAVVLATSSMPVAAQSNKAGDTIGALGNLFGALAQAGAKSKAQKGWAQTNEQVRACVNTTLSSKKIAVDQLIAAGISPTDARVSPLVTSCNQIMSAQLQTNIACNVTNSKGQQVQSLCNQVFAKDVNGQLTEVSRDDFLRAAGAGEKVQVAILETSAANAARLEGERRALLSERSLSLQPLKKQAPATPLEILRLNMPKGSWKLLQIQNNGIGLLAGKKYIGSIERVGNDISFGVFVIPNSDKDVFVPYYNNGKEGFSYGTTAQVLWGWAICGEDKVYFNKVDYFKGNKPNYIFIKSVSANNGVVGSVSAFHQVMSAFSVGKLSDSKNFVANEVRDYCAQ